MTSTESTHKTAEERSKERAAPAQAPPDPGGPHTPLPSAHERQRHESSGLAEGYRKSEPYMAASSTLVASVAAFTALGYWLDRRMGHSVQWLLLVGAVVGMVIGFASFLTKVLRPTTKR